jgi:hypothetical protein
MILKCTASIPLEHIQYYARRFSELPALPEYIFKKGPYVNDKAGAAHQIIVIYEFHQSKVAEALELIQGQLGRLADIPGWVISSRIAKKGREIKYRPLFISGVQLKSKSIGNIRA